MPEIRYFLAECNFTSEEETVFIELSHGRKIQSIEEEIKELWNDADFDEERQLLNKLRGG